MGFQSLIEADRNDTESIAKGRCGESRNRLTGVKSQGPSQAVTLDTTYTAWTMKHPSALRMFDRIMNGAKEKRVVICLDYDGTLSPIVNDPDHAFMSDAMRSAVREVARYFPTAIISGRCRDKVYDFVQLNSVYYAGSHGMDIMAPLQSLTNADRKFQRRAFDKKGNEVVIFQPAQEYLPMIHEIFGLLEEKTRRIHGVLIENNKFCLSVHYRRVDQKDWSTLEEQVNIVLKDYPHFCLTRGRKVIEIRPSIKWNKGNALEYLLDNLGFGSDADILPLYIGDDRTDEDAFKVLQSRGQGYPIIVSSIPKDTNALYSLRDPSEVMSFFVTTC